MPSYAATIVLTVFVFSVLLIRVLLWFADGSFRAWRERRARRKAALRN
jgi:hypothetical protein